MPYRERPQKLKLVSENIMKRFVDSLKVYRYTAPFDKNQLSWADRKQKTILILVHGAHV